MNKPMEKVAYEIAITGYEMSTVDCPRCKKNKLFKEEALNSLSRRDNETYICPQCGTEEALIDAFGTVEDLSWLYESKGE